MESFHWTVLIPWGCIISLLSSSSNTAVQKTAFRTLPLIYIRSPEVMLACPSLCKHQNLSKVNQKSRTRNYKATETSVFVSTLPWHLNFFGGNYSHWVSKRKCFNNRHTFSLSLTCNANVFLCLKNSSRKYWFVRFEQQAQSCFIEIEINHWLLQNWTKEVYL